MANERFTDLPVVTQAQFSDIVCAVQGYTSPTNLGVSSQETLLQIYNLFARTLVLSNPGNPNGVLAGTTYQLCWDTVDFILYVCSVSGTATSAQWSKAVSLTAGAGISISQSGANIQISSTAVGIAYNTITVASTPLIPNNGYIINYVGGTANLTLPTVSTKGAEIVIVGEGTNINNYTIIQNAGQQITVAPQKTTLGVTGSLTSVNGTDSITLVCTVDNLFWQVPAGVQGIFTIV
jgi:hypothetical protein